MIVSNATPLIYLAKVKKLDLLKDLFGEVVISEEVEKEVVDQGKKLGKEDAYVIEKEIKSGWIKPKKTSVLDTPIKMGIGERSTISLAKALGIKEVLIDEVSARTAAKLFGLEPRGIIFVLLKALKTGAISFEQFIGILEQLVKEGFRLKEEIYLEAIEKAREYSEN